MKCSGVSQGQIGLMLRDPSNEALTLGVIMLEAGSWFEQICACILVDRCQLHLA